MDGACKRRFGCSSRPTSDRGFALIIVVLIVAVVAVAAVTLLDLVRLDISFSGEKRVRVLADANAAGSMMEVIGDELAVRRMPNFDAPDLTRTLLRNNLKDPDGVLGPPELQGETTSAFFRNLGTPTEERYDANARLLRTGPVEDTGVETARALVYEVATHAEVHRGRASRDARSEVFLVQPVQTGQRISPRHAR